MLSLPKCHQRPATQLYLGTLVGTAAGVFRVLDEKADTLLAAEHHLLSSRQSSLRRFQAVFGQLMAMTPAFAQAVRPFTRGLVANLRPGWLPTDFIALTSEAKADLEWWAANFHTFNGYGRTWRPSTLHTLIHSDAAGTCPTSLGGWGALARDARGTVLEAAERWTS